MYLSSVSGLIGDLVAEQRTSRRMTSAVLIAIAAIGAGPSHQAVQGQPRTSRAYFSPHLSPPPSIGVWETVATMMRQSPAQREAWGFIAVELESRAGEEIEKFGPGFDLGIPPDVRLPGNPLWGDSDTHELKSHYRRQVALNRTLRELTRSHALEFVSLLTEEQLPLLEHGAAAIERQMTLQVRPRPFPGTQLDLEISLWREFERVIVELAPEESSGLERVFAAYRPKAQSLAAASEKIFFEHLMAESLLDAEGFATVEGTEFVTGDRHKLAGPLSRSQRRIFDLFEETILDIKALGIEGLSNEAWDWWLDLTVPSEFCRPETTTAEFEAMLDGVDLGGLEGSITGQLQELAIQEAALLDDIRIEYIENLTAAASRRRKVFDLFPEFCESVADRRAKIVGEMKVLLDFVLTTSNPPQDAASRSRYFEALLRMTRRSTSLGEFQVHIRETRNWCGQ
jgi:hypothetical protein